MSSPLTLPLAAIKSASNFVLVGPSFAFFSEHKSAREAIHAKMEIVVSLPYAEVFLYRRCAQEWLRY